MQDVNYLIFLEVGTDLAACSNAYVNPMTALGLKEISDKRKAKAVIYLAASSQLAKKFIRLAHLSSIEVICIVRRDEHIKDLKDNYNAEYVLNLTA